MTDWFLYVVPLEGRLHSRTSTPKKIGKGSTRSDRPRRLR